MDRGNVSSNSDTTESAKILYFSTNVGTPELTNRSLSRTAAFRDHRVRRGPTLLSWTEKAGVVLIALAIGRAVPLHLWK